MGMSGIAVALLALAWGPGDLPVQDPLQAFEGPNIGGHFGHASGAAGDVDGDGTGDIIVGAAYDRISAGSAWIFSGRDGSVLHHLVAPIEGRVRFGAAVAGLGDVDGDGFADVVVGAPMTSQGEILQAGAAWIFSGADGSVLHELTGTDPRSQFGSALSRAGDVDADGIDDVIVGAARGNSARVHSGATGALLHRFDGDAGGDRLGAAVAGAGDLDNDGHADLLVGADQGGDERNGAGYARAYSGATGAALFTVVGEHPGDNFGGSVAGAGDVDDDGVLDVIIGAGTHQDFRTSEASGRTRVFSGADGRQLMVLRPRGAFVSGAGDVDRDGCDDLIVGTPFAPSGHGFAGRVRLYSGRDGSLLQSIDGAGQGERFGISVQGDLDLDGDGRPEVIVGSDDFHSPTPARGSVQVLRLEATAHGSSLGHVPSDARD